MLFRFFSFKLKVVYILTLNFRVLLDLQKLGYEFYFLYEFYVLYFYVVGRTFLQNVLSCMGALEQILLA